MDKYDYVINKPKMEEVLYHAGFHKYIDKYLGKNGKWIYKYASQAKSAATGAINKAKTMLPGLQKQATGAVSTVKKKTSSMVSTGSKTASSVKKQAQSRINSMLPILSKKYNSAKKKAKSTYSSTKKSVSKTTDNLKKQANSSYSSAKKSASKTANKLKKQADGTYSKAKNKVQKHVINAKGKVKQKIGTNDSGNYKDPEARGEDAKFQQKNKNGNRGYTKSRAVKSRLNTKYVNVDTGIAAGRKRAKKKATTEKFVTKQLQKSFPHNKSGVYRDYGRSFRTEVQKRKNNVYGTGIESKYLKNPRAGSTRAQGYSSSIGSADNNKATNKALKRRKATQFKRTRKSK